MNNKPTPDQAKDCTKPMYVSKLYTISLNHKPPPKQTPPNAPSETHFIHHLKPSSNFFLNPCPPSPSISGEKNIPRRPNRQNTHKWGRTNQSINYAFLYTRTPPPRRAPPPARRVMAAGGCGGRRARPA